MAAILDFSSIKIDELIVHDIPKHKQSDTSKSPIYSQKVSDLPDGLRLFFKDKIVNALSSDRSFKVCYDTDSTSPMKRHCSDILNDDYVDFVDKSKKIAKHLFDIQVGNNAAGILLIIKGVISGFNSCILMKLERDKGAQLNLNLKTKSFDIVEVKDLMLTQKTKIFKVALLLDQSKTGSDFDGFVTDYQINIKNKKEAITFFIDKFLGCRAFEDPKIATQRFYNLTRSFIDMTDDAVKKTKYLQDLNSYIQKNQNTISPKEFANDYLEESREKNDYKDFLKDNKFSFQTVVKDTQLINSKVRKISVDFTSGVSIVGSKGVLDESVKIEAYGEDQHRAEIISKIKKVS